jgi:hypothetical protein
MSTILIAWHHHSITRSAGRTHGKGRCGGALAMAGGMGNL